MQSIKGNMISDIYLYLSMYMYVCKSTTNDGTLKLLKVTYEVILNRLIMPLFVQETTYNPELD